MASGAKAWIDPSGERFGSMVVLSRLNYDECLVLGIPPGGNGKDCEVLCDCGNKKFMQYATLKKQATCGCGPRGRRASPPDGKVKCVRCGERKPPSEFEEFKSVCIDCRFAVYERRLDVESRRIQRTWETVKTRRRSSERRRAAERRNVLGLFAESYGCMNPGCRWVGLYTLSMLDFHHKVPSDKSYNVSQGVQSRSWESLCEEVRKCVILCASCHRLVHAGVVDISSVSTCEVSERFFADHHLTRCPVENSVLGS